MFVCVQSAHAISSVLSHQDISIFLFLFLSDMMQVTFARLMLKWIHTSDAPLPIYPVVSSNSSSISVFLRDRHNQSALF